MSTDHAARASPVVLVVAAAVVAVRRVLRRRSGAAAGDDRDAARRRPRCGRRGGSREPVVDAVGAQRLQAALDAAVAGDRHLLRGAGSGDHTRRGPQRRHAAHRRVDAEAARRRGRARRSSDPTSTFETTGRRAGRARRRHRRPALARRRRRPVLATGDYARFLQSQGKTKGDVTTSLEALADAIVAKGVQRIPGGIVGDDSRYDDAALRPDVEGQLPHRRRDRTARRAHGERRVQRVVRQREDPGRRPRAATPRRSSPTLLRTAASTSASSGTRDRARGRGRGRAGDVAAAQGDRRARCSRRATTSPPSCSPRSSGSRPRNAGTTAAGRRRDHGQAQGARRARSPTARSNDGSGLDRGNRGHVRQPRRDARPRRPARARRRCYDGLPVAGQNGTLVDQFLGTPLAGNFRGKTGSLDGVSGLAGVRRRSDRRIRFAFLDNGDFSETQGDAASACDIGDDHRRASPTHHRSMLSCPRRSRVCVPHGTDAADADRADRGRRRRPVPSTAPPSPVRGHGSVVHAASGRRRCRSSSPSCATSSSPTSSSRRSSRSSSSAATSASASSGRCCSASASCSSRMSGLRALQDETGDTFTGDWSWVPYLIMFVVLLFGAAPRVGGAHARSREPRRSTDEYLAADDRDNRSPAPTSRRSSPRSAASPTTPPRSPRARPRPASWSPGVARRRGRLPARPPARPQEEHHRRDPAHLMAHGLPERTPSDRRAMRSSRCRSAAAAARVVRQGLRRRASSSRRRFDRAPQGHAQRQPRRGSTSPPRATGLRLLHKYTGRTEDILTLKLRPGESLEIREIRRAK